MQRTDRPIRQHLLQFGIQRQKANPECFHDKKLLFFRQGIQLFGLLCIDGERLFAQNMLAVLQAELAVFVMQGVGRSNVDGIYGGIGGKLFIAGVPVRNVVLRRKGFGTFGPAGADCGKPLALGSHRIDCCGKFVGNGAGS